MFFGYVSLLKTVVFDLLSCGSPVPAYLLFLWLNAGLINSCRVPFAYVWLSYSHHLADDANYSNLRWLWVFFLLVLFCLLVFSHVFHQTVGYVHSQATVVGMPTWWLGWMCPTLPWEPWTCLSNLCSYLPPGMIVVSLQDDHKLVCS